MLEELKAQYHLSLAEKIRHIKALLQEMREGKPDAIDQLRIVAHSLHGSGTTFGFPEITEAARKVEHADNDQLLAQLAALIRVLLEVSARGPAAPRQRKILIIEDDSDISNLLKVMISSKSEQYQVLVANTAAQARELLARHTFTLVVLDLVLPDSDGRVLLKELMAQLTALVPVFVLSAVNREAIQAECLELGARQYFNKPFEPAELADRIHAELNKDGPAATPAPQRPPVAVATQSQPAKPQLTEITANRTVLLAEDDELLAGVIRHRLARDGFQVEHVADGAAALQALLARPYALVILDVKMPVTDGFEVLTRLRADAGANAGIPVIMLTAMGSEKDVVRGYDLGASDYIVKPFSPVELLARVKSLTKPT